MVFFQQAKVANEKRKFAGLMKFNSTLFFLFLLLLIAAEYGCRREFGQPSWQVDAYAPIIKTDLSIRELVQDSVVTAQSPGDLLRLRYNQNLFTLSLDTLFQLPDTVNSQSFSIPVGPINFAPGQTLQADTTTTFYSLNGVQLLEAEFQSGQFVLEIISNIEEALVVTYAIPSSEKDGTPFSFSRTVPAGTFSNPQVLRDTFDLSGYEVNLQGKQLNSYNTITALYSVAVDPNGNQVAISSGDYVTVNTSFVDATPYVARGYFENQAIAVERQEALADFFSIFKSGSLALKDPSIQFSIENEIGIDLTANQVTISGLNTLTGNEVPLKTSLLDRINVSRAIRSSTTPPIKSTRVEVSLNEENANLNEFVSNFPDRIYYEANLEVNPLGNISGYNDFIYYNTGLKLRLSVDIPLQFSASQLVISDTVDFTFNEDSLYENIGSGTLNLVVKNYFPLSVKPGLVFVDEEGTPQDTLLNPSTAISASTQQKEVIPIPINQQVLKNLYRYNRLLILSTLHTNGDTITLRADQNDYLDLTLVLDAPYQINRR